MCVDLCERSVELHENVRDLLLEFRRLSRVVLCLRRTVIGDHSVPALHGGAIGADPARR